MYTIVLAVIGLGLIRRFLVQAARHADAAHVQRLLRFLPGDRTVPGSIGLHAHHFFVGPRGQAIAPERLWFSAHFSSRGHQEVAAHLQHCYTRIEIATATVHDARLLARCSRHVWMSSSEADLILALRLRAYDLRVGRDGSGDDDSGPDPQVPIDPHTSQRPTEFCP